MMHWATEEEAEEGKKKKKKQQQHKKKTEEEAKEEEEEKVDRPSESQSRQQLHEAGLHKCSLAHVDKLTCDR